MAKVDSTIKYYLNKYFGALANKVALGDILNDMTQSHVLKYCGEATTGGGAAQEDISVPGVLATDIVLVTVHTQGAGPPINLQLEYQEIYSVK